MANVAKICEIIFGANPTQDDLREIVRIVSERLPQPPAPIVVEAEPVTEPAEEPTTSKRKGK